MRLFARPRTIPYGLLIWLILCAVNSYAQVGPSADIPEVAERASVEQRLTDLRAKLDALTDEMRNLPDAQQVTLDIVESQRKELNASIDSLTAMRNTLQAIIEISALMPRLSGNTAVTARSKLAELRFQLARMRAGGSPSPPVRPATDSNPHAPGDAAISTPPAAPSPASPAPSSPSDTRPANETPHASTTPSDSTKEGGSGASGSSQSQDPCLAVGDRPQLNPAGEWDYTITGFLPPLYNGSYTGIEVLVDGRQVALAVPSSSNNPGDVAVNPLFDSRTCSFTVWLKHPLVNKETVRIRPTGAASYPWSDEIVVGQSIVSSHGSGVQKTANAGKPHSKCPVLLSDCRDPFEASAYLGLGIDTFASGETLKYLNPDVPNGSKERMVAGFDFGYRLTGRPEVNYRRSSVFWPNQLWIYGETVHGVRSSDVDCTKNPTFLVCKSALDNPERAPDQILFVIRNASSLEGFGGLRYEFMSLQPRFVDAANLYVKAQAGFLSASGRPGSAVAIHHVGLGALATKGKFQDSYLEVGFGRNDLFAEKRKDRWKVDGMLSRELGKGISFFAQITVDTDLGHGSDSIQTYLGFSFDLGRLKFFGSPASTASSVGGSKAPQNNGTN